MSNELLFGLQVLSAFFLTALFLRVGKEGLFVWMGTSIATCQSLRFQADHPIWFKRYGERCVCSCPNPDFKRSTGIFWKGRGKKRGVKSPF